MQLLESFQKLFPELSFPPLPERGDFDLKDVLESPYFFNWSAIWAPSLLMFNCDAAIVSVLVQFLHQFAIGLILITLSMSTVRVECKFLRRFWLRSLPCCWCKYIETWCLQANEKISAYHLCQFYHLDLSFWAGRSWRFWGIIEKLLY